MSSSVVLGVRVILNQYQRIKIDNVDLEAKVEKLRDVAGEKINRKTSEIELIYAGIILDDDSTLSSYGIRNGTTVHVLEKKPELLPIARKMPGPTELQQMATAFDNFGYRTAFQRLSRPEVLEKVLASSPELVEDSAAVALIQDPELLALLANVETMRKTLEMHPALIGAISQIITQIKEESLMTTTQATTSGGLAYSLDALSDDEDMDGDAREVHPLTRNASYNAITSAQLAAAIASATTNFTSSGAPINPPTSGGPVITSEMFGSALQQAIASTPPTNPQQASFSGVGGTTNSGETMETIRARLQPQLRQMREMGLSNEGQNIRALQATSGDVQAAVELVFNGVID